VKRKIVLTLTCITAIFISAFGIYNQADGESKVQPMYGSLLIDGYDFKNDVGPKGTIIYDPEKNEFRGTYIGLKMPEGRRSIFAWVHDTVNQKSEYIGPVGWLRSDTGGKRRGKFTISVPDKFKGGNFGSYEIIGFTAEKTSSLKVTGGVIEVLEKPAAPSGSDINAKLKPAFYLYAPLPGSDTEIHYCGHGGDFFFAKDLDKQFCYD
jgi:hypothetical protein